MYVFFQFSAVMNNIVLYVQARAFWCTHEGLSLWYALEIKRLDCRVSAFFTLLENGGVPGTFPPAAYRCH